MLCPQLHKIESWGERKALESLSDSGYWCLFAFGNVVKNIKR